MLKLVIGNRNYSSWSLRAWLFMRESGLDFEEHRIPMFTATWEDEVRQYSSAGWMPERLDFIDELVAVDQAPLTIG